LRDRLYAERLAGAGTGNDPEPTTRRRDGRLEVMRTEPFGQVAQLRAARLPEDGLDVEAERQLDRLAGRARGRDDDDAPSLPRRDERIVVWREVRVADFALQGSP
jgi:hypothetical protein